MEAVRDGRELWLKRELYLGDLNVRLGPEE